MMFQSSTGVGLCSTEVFGSIGEILCSTGVVLE